MKDKLARYLQKQERNLCRFLQELVRVPTVNPPGENYAECVALLEDQLKSLGMKTRIVPVPSAFVEKCLPGCGDHPRFNLIARWDVGAARTLHFNAHYDVVPVSGQWRFGPFEPKIHDGWLYGRGSADMKGPIAACCYAVKAVQACGLRSAMNLEISFTADEEVGGEPGAGFIVKQGLVNANYAVVCEGASGKNTGVGHNGVLWLRVGVLGKPAHASQPHKGVNAFEKMAALAGELERLKRVYAKRSFKPPHGKIMRPTINQGGVFEVGAGAKVNTVPAYAAFTIDRRINPGESIRDVERELRAAISAARRKVPGLKTEVARVMAIEPCLNDHAGPLPRAFASAIRAVRGSRPRYTVTSGFTDMHYFAIDGRIPTVGYGAGGERMHGVDERVRVQDLVETATVYATVMIDGSWLVG